PPAGLPALSSPVRSEKPVQSASRFASNPGALKSPSLSQQPAAPSQASAGMTLCPQCGTSVPENFKFCGTCGQAITHTRALTGAAQRAASTMGRLVSIRPDGTEGPITPIGTDGVNIGRMGPFASD